MKHYELELPCSYSSIGEDEMTYLDGGSYNISYSLAYATTIGAQAKSIAVRRDKNWNNISHYDLSAEIWFHAYAYYYGSAMNAICGLLGYNGIKNTSFWTSLKNGIDVENGVDTKTEFGVKRYVIFRAAYAYALANPAVI